MSIKSNARKDAIRYAKAKMNYGTGAGIKRRHLNAELNKKLQDESYRKAFNAELENVDYEGIVRGINIKNKTKNSLTNGKKILKNAVKFGTLAAAGYTFYSNNREGIERIVSGVKTGVQNKINKHKYKKQIKTVSMTDAQKAQAYLRTVGIEANYK